MDELSLRTELRTGYTATGCKLI